MRGGPAASSREPSSGSATGTGLAAAMTTSGPPRTRSAGLTLIELTVALAIGAFLLLGATTVFVQSGRRFA